MGFYSKRHYRSVSPAADTAADIADRKLRNEAAELARTDREIRFPTLTAENANAAIEYQESRYEFHYRRLQHETRG